MRRRPFYYTKYYRKATFSFDLKKEISIYIYIYSWTPCYLCCIVPSPSNKRYMTRNSATIPQLRIKHYFLKNSSFLRLQKNGISWIQIQQTLRVSYFQNNILIFILPKPNSISDHYIPKGIKLGTRLGLD